MERNNNKKSEKLGIPHGTACAKLKKEILFHLLCKLGLNICYRCNLEIVSSKELSIDHKIAWLDSSDPVKYFYDLDNIGYSHLNCNVAAATKTNKKYFTAEEKAAAYREMDKASKRRNYTPEKRRAKYLTKGY